MRWVCAGLVANRPNAPATVKRPQPPVLPATLVVNDLLTLPLEERLESFLADGDPGLDAEEALSGS